MLKCWTDKIYDASKETNFCGDIVDPTENRPDIGKLFENYLIAEIAKRNLLAENPAELYFWCNRDRAEVDLIVKQGDQLQPFEIKWGKKNGRHSIAFQNAYGVPVKTLTSTKPSEWMDFC